MAKGITKAQRTLAFSIPSGTGALHYIDSAQSLSMANRKLFSQKKVYGIEKIEFYFTPSTDVAPAVPYESVHLAVSVAGDTWSVHNAWTKGHALHSEMQALVLDDNPSIKGTWAEFKVFLDGDHRQAVISPPAAGNLLPVGYLPGTWDYSTFVMPQHDVDLVTGEPLPADETFAHLLGPNLGNPLTNTLLSAGLVEAYSKSRATVQPQDPAVPAGMSDSFFNLLTDSGSQEPELALVIESENDNPPYDQTSYPGGALNHPTPVLNSIDVANSASPNGFVDGFLAQCGLIQLATIAYTSAGAVVPSPNMIAMVTYAPGMYKGVAAIDMGQ
jgi:hypothetical protein